ncbi:MAG TPA: hypothetical protein VFJ16_04935 [Longimicrobium sp.]|nr:hypothetical protein [Longimicrobium sp.]
MASALSDRPYRVDLNGDEILVRLNASVMSREEVSDLLDYIFLEKVRRQASLSPEQIAELADEVDRATANRLRPIIDEKLRGR